MDREEEATQRISATMGLGDTPHKAAFTRAITNALNTKIAEMTFAQIADGMLLAETVRQSKSPHPPKGHPVYAHTELCAGAIEKVRELRQALDMGDLCSQAELLQKYRAASLGSSHFNLCLVEMAAVALHQFAVEFYQLDTSFHRDDGSSNWTPPEDHFFWNFFPSGSLPTLFYHRWYDNHEKYPNGLADVVAYWAEERIFGGVVLFDRREPESAEDVQPYSVWIHPNRQGVNYRINRLTDEQTLALVSFPTAEEPKLDVLPILPDDTNVVREDPEEPVEFTGIYRDVWERKPWSEEMGDSRLRDVLSQSDYPTRADWERAQTRAYNRRSGYPPTTQRRLHDITTNRIFLL